VATRGREEDPRTFLERAGSTAAAIGDVSPRHPAARFALQWGFAALIFGFLIWFVVRQWSKLPDFDWRFQPGWLVVSAVAVAAFYFLQCEFWRVILHWLGQDLPAAPARAIWGKSILARYVPTNALMVVGRVVMADRYGVPKRICLASIVYELVLQFGTAVIVGAYFVIKLPSLQDEPSRWVILAVIPIVLVGLHPRVFGPIANFGLRKLGREALPTTLPFGRVLEMSLLGAPLTRPLGLRQHRGRLPGGLLRRRPDIHRAQRPRHSRRGARDSDDVRAHGNGRDGDCRCVSDLPDRG
jgi:hypothetical protein